MCISFPGPRHCVRSSPDDTEIGQYLSGTRLYGDDFSLREILSWFEDEAAGYAQLWGKDRQSYRYEYFALNDLHGFRHLPKKQFDHALSVGGAYGDELLPVTGSVRAITLLEPSDLFASEARTNGVPVRYVKPDPSGDMAFPDGTFDLATCFGALHHIPNVSHVVAELYRCVSPGGYVLIREPIISMGDWRFPRSGLTRNERGIPLSLLRTLLTRVGFSIVEENLCMFPLTTRLRFLFGRFVYNSPVAVALDKFASRVFSRRSVYHPMTIFEKLQPASVAYVLLKPQPGR